jgi:hypothetical protein
MDGNPAPAAGPAPAATADQGFADLVLADPDLLRAEFDALIRANWGPSRPPPS